METLHGIRWDIMGFDGAQSNLSSGNVQRYNDGVSELYKTCTASENGFTCLSESAEVDKSLSALIMHEKKAPFFVLAIICV